MHLARVVQLESARTSLEKEQGFRAEALEGKGRAEQEIMRMTDERQEVLHEIEQEIDILKTELADKRNAHDRMVAEVAYARQAEQRAQQELKVALAEAAEAQALQLAQMHACSDTAAEEVSTLKQEVEACTRAKCPKEWVHA